MTVNNADLVPACAAIKPCAQSTGFPAQAGQLSSLVLHMYAVTPD